MQDDNLLARLRRFDQARDSLPGEHLFNIAVGGLLLTRRSRSPVGWLVSHALGAALVARGLSGRDGALAWARGRLAERAQQASAVAPADAGLQALGQGWPADQQARLARQTQKIDDAQH